MHKTKHKIIKTLFSSNIGLAFGVRAYYDLPLSFQTCLITLFNAKLNKMFKINHINVLL